MILASYWWPGDWNQWKNQGMERKRVDNKINDQTHRMIGPQAKVVSYQNHRFVWNLREDMSRFGNDHPLGYNHNITTSIETSIKKWTLEGRFLLTKYDFQS